MQPTGVVDLIDEAGQIGHDVAERLVGHRVDRLDLQRLHEAFGLGIVIGVCAPAHGAFELMVGQDLAVGGTRVRPGFNQSSQRQPDLTAARRREPRRAFSSQASCVACR